MSTNSSESSLPSASTSISTHDSIPLHSPPTHPAPAPRKSALKSPTKSNPTSPEISAAIENSSNAFIPLASGCSSDTSSFAESIPMAQSEENHTLKVGGPLSNRRYSKRVGFDTMDINEPDLLKSGGGTGVNYSFTLQTKSLGYEWNKSSRTFLIATDLNEYSVEALHWALLNLAEDGDELVILRVIEPGTPVHSAWKSSQEEARAEAQNLMDDIMSRNRESILISIIVEFAIGPIEETIHRMIDIYQPDSLVVGTRGRKETLWNTAFMGSVSKYCVARSPVPVVVVRPQKKIKQSLEKRLADPSKRSYLSLLSNSKSAVALDHSPDHGLSKTISRVKEEEDYQQANGRGNGKNPAEDDGDGKGKKTGKKELALGRFKTVG